MNISKVLISLLMLISASTAFSQSAWSQFGTSNQEPYNRSGDSFSRGETLKGGDVIDAVVLSVRPVTIEASGTSQNGNHPLC